MINKIFTIICWYYRCLFDSVSICNEARPVTDFKSNGSRLFQSYRGL